MLVHFSKNFKNQVIGIVLNNHLPILWFIAISSSAYILFHIVGLKGASLPIAPVSILGVAVAIFLGFRNSSAYDRWWEARKIWGGIVNNSRSWAMEVTSFIDDEDSSQLQKERKTLVYRHLAWINALDMHLRKKMDLNRLEPFLDHND